MMGAEGKVPKMKERLDAIKAEIDDLHNHHDSLSHDEMPDIGESFRGVQQALTLLGVQLLFAAPIDWGAMSADERKQEEDEILLRARIIIARRAAEKRSHGVSFRWPWFTKGK
jgi:hypothetical protein